MKESNKDTLPVGKLPMKLLDQLLKRIPMEDPDILVGPGLGEDAAVINVGGETIILKTDPITFATKDLASYLVAVNSNDIACMGGIPRYILVDLLLPEEKTTYSIVEAIFNDIISTCKEYGITILGGHTEITHGIDRPIATGFMVGYSPDGRIVRTSGARPGDVLLLSKGIPIEALSILAREKADHLDLDCTILEEARNLIKDPGISVLKEARIAIEKGEVSAMHDPTEGGIATGLLEIARACGHGLEVYMDKIPIMEHTHDILGPFSMDPLGSISSGALIVCCSKESARAILDAWQAASITGSIIGYIREDKRCLLHRDGKIQDLPEFPRDEIAKAFA
ncbi:MAG: AIR synthase family protein [Deltaproteobacteria bacterium]|nr:AIR synthase family protein [Deltaproteobacteria bacterium]